MTAAAVQLSDLLRRAGVRPLDARGGDPAVSGVTLDSRLVSPGDLFFALRGDRHDGLGFVTDAIARGAVAIAADRPPPAGVRAGAAWVTVGDAREALGSVAREIHGRPDEALVLAGITGTNGKTTVAWMAEAMARAAGLGAGRIGTIGHAWGGNEHPAVRTTPEAPDLFRLLADMRDAGVEFVAMEVSSHALELRRVNDARFAVAAFLNLGRDHLDFHGDVESYFRAKARLFEGLDENATAVLPARDPRGEALAERTRAGVLWFGRDAGADVRIVEEVPGLDGSRALFQTPRGEIAVRVRIPGAFNVTNAAAAAACAIAAGLPLRAIADGLESLARVPGRMERIDLGQAFTVLVDYAHTPDALESALRAARGPAGRLIVVFGCGGERDRGKRGEMGSIAARLADAVVLTSDNPRGEDPAAILADIRRGAAAVDDGEARTSVVSDRAEAIRAALASAGAGDAVLVAGKGHETTQSAGGRVWEMDDREVVREMLREQGWTGGTGAGD